MKAYYKPIALLSFIAIFSFMQTIAQPLPLKSANCQDFFMSIEKGMYEEVNECLNRNPKLIYKTNDNEFTPLMVACAYGQTDIMALLIANKASVNVGNSDQLYPIHLATLSGNEKAVRLLLKKKSNPMVLTKSNLSVMDYAAMTGNKKLLDYFARKESKLRDDKDIMLATAQGGDLSLFNHLRSKGYNINFKDENSNGVLHYAAKGGSAVMCKYLVDYYQFDIREENGDGKYPIEMAIESGNLEVVKYFFSKGVAPNETNKFGKKWIDISKENGWIHISNYLDKQNRTLQNLNVFESSI